MTALVDVGSLTILFRNVPRRHWASKGCIDPPKENTSEFYQCSSQLYHQRKVLHYIYEGVEKGKAIPLQARAGPEGSSTLRLTDFMKIGTQRW
jgi:hypothetical protein